LSCRVLAVGSNPPPSSLTLSLLAQTTASLLAALEVSCSIPPHYPARTMGALLGGVLSAAPQAARGRAAMARTEAATTAAPASSKLKRCSFTKAPAVFELDSLGGEADAAKVSSARGTLLSSSALTSA